MSKTKNIRAFKKTIETNTERIIFDRQENKLLYLGMSWSEQLYTAIISADESTLFTLFETDSADVKGTMARGEIRDLKNQLLILLSGVLYKLENDRFIEPNITHAFIDSISTLLEEQTKTSSIREVVMAGLLAISDEVQREKRIDYHPLVRRTESYVFSHLHEKISVSELALAFSIDPEYLTTVFHRYTGRTIKQYILDEKINRSRNLLINSDYGIKEIALYLGFADSSHFGREFKKRLRISPTAYRKLFLYK